MPTPTTDFSIFDGQESVAYSALSGPVLEGVAAMRRPLTQSRQRNIERYVELEVTDVVFHLDGAPFDGVELAAGDTLTGEYSAVYSVLFVERQTLRNTVVAVGRLAV